MWREDGGVCCGCGGRVRECAVGVRGLVWRVDGRVCCECEGVSVKGEWGSVLRVCMLCREWEV